jgi:hypothetical protein
METIHECAGQEDESHFDIHRASQVRHREKIQRQSPHYGQVEKSPSPFVNLGVTIYRNDFLKIFKPCLKGVVKLMTSQLDLAKEANLDVKVRPCWSNVLG